jgi:RNase P/RNase MRP subunit POP5
LHLFQSRLAEGSGSDPEPRLTEFKRRNQRRIIGAQRHQRRIIAIALATGKMQANPIVLICWP